MNAIAGDAAHLRRALADRLEAAGDLRSGAWRRAVEQVPREMFLGDRVYRRVDTPTATLWEPLVSGEVGAARWLDLAYEDTTWVTQFDSSDQHRGGGAVQGVPTSSSTLPGLVVRMLEDLDVHDGCTVLEVGTGTGYSTALLCQRLGDERVTSVEVDPGVAARASAALTAAGHAPTLITGDGLAGNPGAAPFDRVISSCSVRAIPPAWVTQTRPGGRILTTISGWLFGSGLLALGVNGDGTAHGRFLSGTVSFMPARAHTAPALSGRFPAPEGDSRPTELGAALLNDWMGRFLAQLAAPTAQHALLTGDHDSPPTTLLIEQATGSCAWLTETGDGWTVRQHGPVRLWDQIEHTYRIWQSAGRPAQHQFSVSVTPRGQIVRLDTSDSTHSWPLPQTSVQLIEPT